MKWPYVIFKSSGEKISIFDINPNLFMVVISNKLGQELWLYEETFVGAIMAAHNFN